MSKQGITQIAPVGRYCIAWDDIRTVVIDKGGNSIAFKGDDKQLVLPGFSFWAGPDAAAMKDYMFAELERRGIETRVGFAAFAWSRNTRMR